MLLEAFLVIILTLSMLVTVRRPKNFPPGPPVWPIIGNYFDLCSRDPAKKSEIFNKKYGGLVGMVVPFYRTVFVNSWGALKEMLLSEDCIGRPDTCLVRDRFESGKHGIFFTDGEPWRRQRHFILQAFRGIGFGRNRHEEVVIREAQELVKLITNTEGQAQSYEEMFYMANLNIVWILLSGRRHDYQEKEFVHLETNVKSFLKDIQIFGGIACIFPWLRYIFPKATGYKTLKETSIFMRNFIKKAIEEHKSLENYSRRDFLDFYLEEIKRNSKSSQSAYSENELVGICMDLLLGGSDTTAGHLGFSVLFLCLRKDVQDKIYKEILQVLGKEGQVTMADKPQFIYMEAFLMEVLRYRTVVPCFAPHAALRDTTLGGYFIPKGTVLFPIITSVFSDKKHWEDPQNFRPERFISEDGKIKKEPFYIPFGKGKRSCIGEMISKMSTFIIMTTLIQKFEFSLPEGSNPDTSGIPGFTYSPHPYKVIAKLR